MDPKVRRELAYVFSLHCPPDTKMTNIDQLPSMLQMLDCNFSAEQYNELKKSIGCSVFGFETFCDIVRDTDWGFIERDEIKYAFEVLKDDVSSKVSREVFLKAVSSLGHPIKKEEMLLLLNEAQIGSEMSFAEFESL